MKRRSLLALLGVGAAAIATPEPVRSYFFGPWAPRPSGVVVGSMPYGWDPVWAAELVDKHILPVSDFIAIHSPPRIWNEDLLVEQAVWRRVKQDLPDLARSAQARSQRVGLCVPVPSRLLPVAASSQDEPLLFQTITESVMVVEIDQRQGILLDNQNLAEISARTADKLARWMGNALEDLIFQGNTAMDPYAGARVRPWPADMTIGSPNPSLPPGVVTGGPTLSYSGLPFTLTPDEFMRAQQALRSCGPPPFPHLPGPVGGGLAGTFPHPQRRLAESLLDRAGCLALRCLSLTEDYDLRQLQWRYVHVGPAGQHTQFAVSDEVRRRGGDQHELYGSLLRWLIDVHQAQARACPLCGAEREPDQEPIVLELPMLQDGPGTFRGPHRVEACSPHCATAYAMQVDMARNHEPVRDLKRRPDLREEAERRARANYRLARASHDDITDSDHPEPFRPLWGIFSDEPE